MIPAIVFGAFVILTGGWAVIHPRSYDRFMRRIGVVWLWDNVFTRPLWGLNRALDRRQKRRHAELLAVVDRARKGRS